MKKVVSFILFLVMLITVGGCLWVHEREGDDRERGERRERHERERDGDRERGEHERHEFEERR